MAKKSGAKKSLVDRPAGGGRQRLRSSAGPSPAVDPWILLGLSLATLVVYAQVGGHQFISLDDDVYIRENPMVARGLSWGGIAWAFTTFHQANWHPLTWLSHMVDSQLFGLYAGGHLLVNALFHTANSLLVFWVLRRATGARWPSALVAALFALHPLHVESVAWAAERKDTLAAFCGLLTLLAYLRYVRRPSPPAYALVVLGLAFGLMAKPMLVTWPLLLLLLDYWPLRRLAWPADGRWGRFALEAWPLVREKWLLFALAAASMVITVMAQSRGGAVRTLADAPVSLRLCNALVSYAKYLGATFWPRDLAVYYPFSGGEIPFWQPLAAFILLAGITAGACVLARTQPYLLVGWLWFVGTLVPVIGVVQVGGQMMADRYHYLPSIGLFLALIFGAADLAARWQIGRVWLGAASAAVLLLCAVVTERQLGYWRNSETLFNRTLALTKDNMVIEYNLGHVLGLEKRYDEALTHFSEALRVDPDYPGALVNKGMVLASLGKAAAAIPNFQHAIRVAPNLDKAHTQLALALVQLDRKAEALAEFRRALELDPAAADAHSNYGLILFYQRQLPEAETEFRKALRLDPRNPEAHNNLGLLLLASGRACESIAHFRAALQLRPDYPVALANLRRAQEQTEAEK